MNFTYKLPEIHDAAKTLWREGKQYKTWAFHGQMGAGKTTLVHALCEVLEVNDAISSPTFAIINEYRSPLAGVIYHMDWYRLKDEEEALQAGVEDCLLSGNLCLVEWPEKASGLLPDDTLHITIETINTNNRMLNLDTGQTKS